MDKQCGQITSTSLIAVGSHLLLTKNQKSLTTLGLNNDAIGTVIAFWSIRIKKPPEFPEAVVADFQDIQVLGGWKNILLRFL